MSGCPRHRAAPEPGCTGCDRVAAARTALAQAAESEPRVDWPAVADQLPWRRAHAPRPSRVPLSFLALAGGAALALLGVMLVLRPTSGNRRRGQAAAASLPRPSAPTPAAAGASATVAHATAVAGVVRAERTSHGWASLEIGQRLPAGTRLLTEAGRASLQWGAKTGAQLGERSELAMSELDAQHAVFALDRGAMTLRVAPRPTGETVEVRTPGHTVTVHGTWFEVRRDAGRTQVTVCDGRVAVSARGMTGVRLLERGHTATFQDGAIAPSPARSSEGGVGAAARCGEPWMLGWPDNITFSLLRLDGAHADLVLDSLALGPTPAAIELPPGRHKLDIVRPGMRETRWLQVTPGEQLVKIGEPDLRARAAQMGARVPAHDDDVRLCYERGLKRDPALRGAPTLRLSVGADGHVKRADVVKSDLGDMDVEACITSAAQRWAFPPGPPITFDATLDLRAHR